MRRFDLVVIGCGQGADPLARAFAAAGKQAAIIERKELGGSCVNWGCTPTKTLGASAEVAHLARRAGDYGIRTGEVTVDYRAVHARKNRLVLEFREGLEKTLAETEGIEVIRGEARFVGPHELAVGDERIEGDIVVIDTGTHPQIPDLPGLKDVRCLTAAELMGSEELPGHLIILGGGYIGLEFAQIYRRFGSEVTIIEKGDRVLAREDPDVTDALSGYLVAEGIAIECGAEVLNVAEKDGEIVLTLRGEGKTARQIRGTHLLVATSQAPNTGALDLARAGIEMDEKGYVKVDSRLATNVEGVYAIGDVKGGPAFTHISYDDFRVLRTNLLYGGDRTIEGRPVPYCVFTDPPLARVGLSESEAKKKGVSYRVGTLKMTELGLPNERSETEGFIKVLVAEDGTILGAACLAVEAADQMAFFQIAMMGGVKAEALNEAVFAHPTLAEGLNKVFWNLKAPA